MQFLKIPFLLGALAATTLVSHAQTLGTTSTSVAGQTPRVTPQTSPSNSGVTSSQRIYSGCGDRNRGDRRYGNGSRHYYVPAPSYPYPNPAYNNYYYPALPSTTEVTPRPYNWTIPSTVTNIPLGTYYNGYPAPAYPSYPAYPGYGYPAPAYGYPAPGYGYPAYPGVPYPAYGGTYYNGVGTGSVYSQSQNSGYGLSVGSGGISVQLGNRTTTSSTTVSRY